MLEGTTPPTGAPRLKALAPAALGAESRLDIIQLPSAVPLQATVFFFHRLGDMVMLTALLQYLHRRYRRPCQVVGAGSWTAAVYAGNPDVARVFSFHRHLPFPLSFEWRRLVRALRESDPGPIYICEHHYRQLPRIRRMLALARINPQRCVYICEEREARNRHFVDRLVRFGKLTPAALREEDYPLPRSHRVWAPQVRIADGERAACEAWLAERGWSRGQLIIVQPGNHRSMSRPRMPWRRKRSDDKSWPIECWAALLNMVHARAPEAVIILRGAAAEVPMLEQIREAAGLSEVGVAGLALRPFFALCARAYSMISVDTGPAHAAAALGVPLVVLFGAHWPSYWAPRSATSSPVITVGGPPQSVRADQISVQTVFDAWCELARRANAASPPAASVLHGSSATSGKPAVRR